MSKLSRIFIISTLLACLLVIFTIAANSDDESVRDEVWTDPTPAFIYGDANGDGAINTKDLALLRKYLANSNPLTGESTVTVAEGTDNNGDGTIDTKDLALLRKYLANSNPLTGESSVVLGPKN